MFEKIPATYKPKARTEHFDLNHIGKDKLGQLGLDAPTELTTAKKVNLMRDIFNQYSASTKFQVIESGGNKTNVILRNMKGSGAGMPRYSAGKDVTLVSAPGLKSNDNTNGFAFKTFKGADGKNRIYILVQIDGKKGYMAMEHIGAKVEAVGMVNDKLITDPVQPLRGKTPFINLEAQAQVPATEAPATATAPTQAPTQATAPATEARQ